MVRCASCFKTEGCTDIYCSHQPDIYTYDSSHIAIAVPNHGPEFNFFFFYHKCSLVDILDCPFRAPFINLPIHIDSIPSFDFHIGFLIFLSHKENFFLNVLKIN